jgi:hypothetical protein
MAAAILARDATGEFFFTDKELLLLAEEDTV